MTVEMNDAPIRILALCGSLRSKSHTRKALQIVLKGAAGAGAKVHLADLAAYDLGFCSGAKDGAKPDALRLKEEIRAAHGVILGTPEYHGGYSGVLKNALDLLDIEDFEHKVVGLLGVAGGRMGAPGALSGLRGVVRALKAWALPLDVSIAEAGRAFGEDGQALDPKLQERLLELGKLAVRFSQVHAEMDGIASPRK